jgi:hypothetical protein
MLNDKLSQPMDHAPWESGSRADVRAADRARTAEDKAAYYTEWGHIERRHTEQMIVAIILRLLIAVIGGLVMALGFHPFFVLVGSVAAWKGIDEMIEENESNDAVRRASYGID